jgi:hypothetical protein
VISAEVPGPHQEQDRVQFSITGVKLGTHKQLATIFVLRDRARGGWAFYLDGDARQAITVTDADVWDLFLGMSAHLRVCEGCGGLGVQPPTVV